MARWRWVAGAGVAVLVLAYAFSLITFRASVDSGAPNISPPAVGVRVVFVPQRVNAEDQSVLGKVILFPAASLTLEDGRLIRDVLVDVVPSVDGGTLSFPGGRQPEPKSVVLPALGTIQNYPFDGYQFNVSISVTAPAADGMGMPIVSESTTQFRMPGWHLANANATTTAGTWSTSLQGRILRAGSTRAIALALLTLMLILATIAVALVSNSLRGRLRWEFVHATWMTSMLFALMPLRSSFPGAPPLGVWIDILVFFWVELAIMSCVAITASALVIRANPKLREG